VLLAVDVGNTQTAIGLFDGDRLGPRWRLATRRELTADDLAAQLDGLLRLKDLRREDIDSAAVASSVPSLGPEWARLGEQHLGVQPLVVGPGTRSGMAVLMDNPREVGPDRVASAVAALARHGGPCIVVDFGTATTFDAVSAAGEYVGGVIAPGVEISMDALFDRAARLTKVDLVAPRTVIGKTTVACMQSGVVYGFAGMVDGIVTRMRSELGADAVTVATGGLADLVVPHAATLETHEPDLTLEGLSLLWQRNRG
jgi:type III pantothenate kinase